MSESFASLRAVFARIRGLRESTPYFLVILLGRTELVPS